ncbi:U-box domain-containing protein 15 [Linum grandiflorum]
MNEDETGSGRGSPSSSSEEGFESTSPRDGNDDHHVVDSILRVIESVARLGGYRGTHHRECIALVRRMKTFLPFLEEVRDFETTTPISEEGIGCLKNLKATFVVARKLLRICNEGSKIYLTYERESIQKWLEANHMTCPKTRQTLENTSIAPNYALKNLIHQWCDKHKFKLPKKDSPTTTSAATTTTTDPANSSPCRSIDEVATLVEELSSSNLDVQRRAVKEIRMLSKESPENRVSIADAGGISPIVDLLGYPDSKIQEHAVTALLNLSLDKANKRAITEAGAIPAIVDVLQSGSREAKENSAAALFSLSMLDENKVAIGLCDGIPPLVDLLQRGTMRGKKDALTALFNLCLNDSNKEKAIEAGIVDPLLQLLKDRNLNMIDETLSIFLLLASHPEGRNAVGQLPFIEMLVGFMAEGTPKNKECATSVLLELGSGNSNYMLMALQFGAYEHLVEMSESGTDRGKRKANSLIQLMSKSEQL